MSKRSITTRWEFWAVIGLSVAVIALIIAGLLGLSPKDAGLMTYCRLNDIGEVIYEDTGGADPKKANCSDAKAVSLETVQRPWKVQVAGDGDFTEAVSGAIREFNSRVGCKLLEVPSGTPSPDIVITKDAVLAGYNDHPGGSTSHQVQDDGVWKSSIVIYNLVTSDELQRGIMHELGHAAGLAHDPFKDSLMYKGTSGTDRLTDEDRDVLRKLYCRGR